MPARFASARFAAAALAAALLALPLGAGASAADLYGDGYGPPPDAGHPPAAYPYADRGPPDAYGEPDDWADAEPGPGRSDVPYAPEADPYRGPPRDGYAAVPPPPPSAPYAYRERAERYAGDRGDDRYGPGCIPPARIRARLAGEGWTGFRLIRQRSDLVTLSARRVETGRVFTLRLEPCSGAIVDARPVFLRTFAPDRPYRRWAYWGRPY